MNESTRQFASRAGIKLAHALEEFELDVTRFICADFGCNVGGFTDCLLQQGAARVYAIDTGYGTLAYRLRQDERVIVMERTNALHAEPPDIPVNLVTIDLAWTPQRLAIPAALRWLRPAGRIITLVKPHYELTEDEKAEHLTDGFLDPANAPLVLGRVLERMPQWGARVIAHAQSPITGGKTGRRRRKRTASAGNIEYLVLAAALNE